MVDPRRELDRNAEWYPRGSLPGDELRRWTAIEPPPADLRAVKTGERGEVYRLVTEGPHEGEWRNEHGAYWRWGNLREVDLIEVR